MNEVLLILALGFMAGLAIPLGAFLARLDASHKNWLSDELRHSIVSFGGGALISAIALVLVPEGTKNLSTLAVTLSFALGGLAFFALDILLNKLKSPAGQLVAMLSDYIPEAIALGAAFAYGNSSGILLALLITLQNLPEGFNAYREITKSHKQREKSVLLAFVAMSFFGPVAALAGYFYLAEFPEFMGEMMLFASGGILYLIFQDIAPEAKLERAWAPSLGAVMGFLLGLIGHMLLVH